VRWEISKPRVLRIKLLTMGEATAAICITLFVTVAL